MDPKERPGASKGRAKQAKLVPRRLPRSLRDAQDCPKGAQEDPRMNQREPKGNPKGAQDDHKRSRSDSMAFENAKSVNLKLLKQF